MGRGLKISKAQAVLTLTATSATTQLVTVSQNLSTEGIIAGMPFTVASNVGNLVAGTTYFINNVASNTTFGVSATQLSVQPQTLAVLTTTTGQTVNTTVGFTDNGYNNPNGSNTATNGTSYGVVGGNTAQYANTVLCNVAFGVEGTGTQIAVTNSEILVGVDTNFASIANGTHIFAQYGTTGYGPNVVPGTGAPVFLGVVANNIGNVTVGIANTNATGNIIGTAGNAELFINGPVVFDTSFGGLTANTIYFVNSIASNAAFTVSATSGGADVQLTSNASVTANAIQQQLLLTANAAAPSSGVGGYGDSFIEALPEAGYIVRQKGKYKYLVQGTVTGILGAAYTANVANTALTPNTFNVIATYANSSTQYVQSLSDYQSQVFPSVVADGSLTIGDVYTIYQSGNTNWTAVGAYSNITGITFTATGVGGSGTGLAVLSNDNPDVIGTFGTAYAANTYPGTNPITGQTSNVSGQPNPIVTINNA